MHGGYPLHYAAQMCGPAGELTSTRLGLAVLRTLLSHGVEVNVTDQDGRQPILWAASAGSADAILALVNAGANVEADDKDGLTALHCAASRGHTDCLETLVSLCGAAVDVMDSNGCTPLFYAVTLGHADATQLLLEHGAQPNRQDRKGRTPAHCGAAKGQLETLRILASRGANMWARNVKGDYPLHEAVASGRKDLVRWLLSQRPDAVNASNNDGRCPLHIAAINNNVEMCKILLDHESLVNPVMRTVKGGLMTPLDAALYKGNRGCAKYLQLHGGVPANKLTSQSAALRGIMQRGEPHSDQMATPDWGPNLAVPDLRGAQSLVQSPIDLKHLSVVEGTRTLEVRVEDDLHRRGSESSADDRIKRRRRKRRPKRISDGSEEETDSSDRHRRRRRRRRKNVENSSEDESETDIRRQKTKSKKDKDTLGSESEGTPKRKKKDNKHHRRRSVSSDRGKEESRREKTEEVYYDKKLEETKITENENKLDDKSNDLQRESRKILKEEITTKEVTKSKKVTELKEREKISGNPPVTKMSKTTCEETKTEEQITTKTSQIISAGSESKGDDVSTQDSQDTPVQQVVTAIVHQEETAEQESPVDHNEAEGENAEKVLSQQEAEDIKDSGVTSDQGDAPKDEVSKEIPANEVSDNVQKEITSEKDELEEVDDGDFWGESENIPAEQDNKQAMGQDLDKEGNEVDNQGAEISHIDKKASENEDGDEKSVENVEDGQKAEDDHKLENLNNHEEDDKKREQEPLINEQNLEDIKASEPAEEEKGSDNEGNQTQELSIDTTHQKEDEKIEKENSTPLPNREIREDNIEGPGGTSSDNIVTQVERIVDGEDTQENLEEGSPSEARNDENFFEEQSKEYYDDSEEQGSQKEGDTSNVQDSRERGLIKVLGRSEVDDENFKGVVKVEKINSEVLKDRGRVRERARDRRRPSSFEIVSPARSLPDEDIDSETPRSRSRTGADSSQLQDSGFEPSPRRDSKKEMSRIPRACRRSSSHSRLGADSDDDRPPLSTISVTQAVQHSMRKYHLERRIFHELLELKRLQIRAGRSNEAVLVKRLVDDYRRAGLWIGLKPYEGVYTFRAFEKYLYDQLRLLQSSDRRIIPRLKSTDDLEKLTKALRRTRAGNTLLDNVPQDPLVCTHGTHRCFHATHAYTGVPCAAYIAKINHHTMPKTGAPTPSFLPRIDSGKTKIEGQGAAEIARCLRYVDPSRPVTLELSHGSERQVISLPTEKLDKNKRYYVTFTIKGGDVTTAGPSRDKEKHRHAKSF